MNWPAALVVVTTSPVLNRLSVQFRMVPTSAGPESTALSVHVPLAVSPVKPDRTASGL